MTQITTPAQDGLTQVVTEAQAKKTAFDTASATVETAAKDNASKRAAKSAALALAVSFDGAVAQLATFGQANGDAIARTAKGKAQFTGAAYGKDVASSVAAILAAAGDEIEGEEAAAKAVKDAKKLQKDFITKDAKGIEGDVNADDPFAFTLGFTENVAKFVQNAIEASTAAEVALNLAVVAKGKAEYELKQVDAKIEKSARAAYIEKRAAAKASEPASDKPAA